MKEFTTTPKKWGNSLGVIIPKEIVDEVKLSPKKKIKLILVDEPKFDWEKVFGSIPDLGKGKTTQELMEEIDRELYPNG